MKNTLSQNEEKILKIRSEGKTYAKIGKIFNTSRERIRQIARKALRKLNHV